MTNRAKKLVRGTDQSSDKEQKNGKSHKVKVVYRGFAMFVCSVLLALPWIAFWLYRRDLERLENDTLGGLISFYYLGLVWASIMFGVPAHQIATMIGVPAHQIGSENADVKLKEKMILLNGEKELLEQQVREKSERMDKIKTELDKIKTELDKIKTELDETKNKCEKLHKKNIQSDGAYESLKCGIEENSEIMGNRLRWMDKSTQKIRRMLDFLGVHSMSQDPPSEKQKIEKENPSLHQKAGSMSQIPEQSLNNLVEATSIQTSLALVNYDIEQTIRGIRNKLDICLDGDEVNLAANGL